MKKSIKEKVIYVLTKYDSCNPQEDNKVAVGEKEQLERYYKQLLDNGYKDVFKIEKRVYVGSMVSTVRFLDYNLNDIDGILYPSRNIREAERILDNQIKSIMSTYESLKELKEEALAVNKEHYDVVLADLEERLDKLRNRPLQIEML